MSLLNPESAAVLVLIIAVAAGALLLWEHTRLIKLRQTHSELAASANSLEQSVSQAIITVDSDGSIRGYNPAAQALFGYEPEEIQGHNIFRLVLLGSASKPEARENRTGLYEMEVEAQRKDGTLLPVWLRAVPLNSRKGRRIRFFIEDLTRFQHQAQLELENQLLWPTFDEAGLVIALVNPTGEIIRLSNAGAKLLSVADAGVEGRLYWEIFQRPEDWDSARSTFERAKRKLGPSRLQSEWIAPDQASVPLDWMMLSPAWDAKGELAHIVVTAALASKESIASRRETFRTIERIAGRIAGHFENLLSTINGYSELVLHDLSPTSPLRKDVEQILAASERASETTRQLLGFSGRRLLSTERLELNALLRKVNRNSALRLHHGPLTVLGNRKAFEEMLTVLIEYAASRSWAITFATEPARLEQTRSTIADDLAPGDYVMLNVILGKAPEEEVLQHLLEPFGSPLRGTRDSTVGLAVVNGIARSCGGGLSLSRSADETVTLQIWLPSAGAAEECSAGEPAPEAKAASASRSL